MLLKILPTILMTIPYIYQLYNWYYTESSKPNIKPRIIEDSIKTIKDSKVVIADIILLRQDIIDEYNSIRMKPKTKLHHQILRNSFL